MGSVRSDYPTAILLMEEIDSLVFSNLFLRKQSLKTRSHPVPSVASLKSQLLSSLVN